MHCMYTVLMLQKHVNNKLNNMRIKVLKRIIFLNCLFADVYLNPTNNFLVNYIFTIKLEAKVKR